MAASALSLSLSSPLFRQKPYHAIAKSLFVNSSAKKTFFSDIPTQKRLRPPTISQKTKSLFLLFYFFTLLLFYFYISPVSLIAFFSLVLSMIRKRSISHHTPHPPHVISFSMPSPTSPT